MAKSRVVFPVLALLLALAGCSSAPQPYDASTPCAGGNESSYDCQVYRYQRVGM